MSRAQGHINGWIKEQEEMGGLQILIKHLNSSLGLAPLSADCLKLLRLHFSFRKFLGPFNHGNSHDDMNGPEGRSSKSRGIRKKMSEMLLVS